VDLEGTEQADDADKTLKKTQQDTLRSKLSLGRSVSAAGSAVNSQPNVLKTPASRNT